MNNKFCAGIAVIIAVLAGCAQDENLKSLSSMETETLLKGNTIEGVLIAQSRPFKQYFGANGTTVQMIDSKRIGKWYIDDNNQFCIRWSEAKIPEKMARRTEKQGEDNSAETTKPKDGQCLSVKQDSQGKYRIYSAKLGYVASLGKIVPGNPGKF